MERKEGHTAQHPDASGHTNSPHIVGVVFILGASASKRGCIERKRETTRERDSFASRAPKKKTQTK